MGGRRAGPWCAPGPCFACAALLLAAALPGAGAAPRQLLAPGEGPEGGGGARVLAVFNGQMRGGPLAWLSFKRFVLDAYGADLAYLGPPPVGNGRTFLQQHAKYEWVVDDPEDWGSLLGDTEEERRVIYNVLCKQNQEAQFLGGVKCCGEHPKPHKGCDAVSGRAVGSAGMLLVYRKLLRQKLEELGLVREYDFFIFTRTDYVFLCPLMPVSDLERDGITVPDGEGYGGFTDRFSIMPQRHVLESLGVGEDLVRDHVWWLGKTYAMNLEIALAKYHEKISVEVHKYPHPAFTVKLPDDPTSWIFTGYEIDKYWEGNGTKYHLLVKYPSEMQVAETQCGMSDPSELLLSLTEERAAYDWEPNPPPVQQLAPRQVGAAVVDVEQSINSTRAELIRFEEMYLLMGVAVVTAVVLFTLRRMCLFHNNDGGLQITS